MDHHSARIALGSPGFLLSLGRDLLSHQLPSQPTSTHCPYCGQALDERIYFCPRCARPYKHPDTMLPASLPKYEDTETRLRTKAGPAWTVFFVYMIVIVLGSMIAMAAWGDEDAEPMFLLLDFALLVTTIVCTARFWKDLKPLFGRLGLFQPWAWFGLALLVPLLALNYGYHSFLVELLSAEKEDFTDYFSSKWGPIIFICVMPAIVEEIAFRGIIQDQFEKVVSPKVAILVASLVFSAAHFNILSAPYLALVGVLLGWLKWKTGSLYPAMVAHFLHNYVVVTYF